MKNNSLDSESIEIINKHKNIKHKERNNDIIKFELSDLFFFMLGLCFGIILVAIILKIGVFAL